MLFNIILFIKVNADNYPSWLLFKYFYQICVFKTSLM